MPPCTAHGWGGEAEWLGSGEAAAPADAAGWERRATQLKDEAELFERRIAHLRAEAAFAERRGAALRGGGGAGQGGGGGQARGQLEGGHVQ